MTLRGSAVTVLFLLLFAGSVMQPASRAREAAAPSNVHGVSIDARALFEAQCVAERVVGRDVAPRLRPTPTLPVLWFRRCAMRGIPAPRAPDESGRGSIA